MGYPTSMAHFSQQDANHDQHYSGASVKVLPDSLPMYAVPQGLKGHKPQPKPFCPGGACK